MMVKGLKIHKRVCSIDDSWETNVIILLYSIMSVKFALTFKNFINNKILNQIKKKKHMKFGVMIGI